MITVRPQWVMVGFPADPALVYGEPGQVAILASTKLTQAQMEYTARRYDFRDFEEFRRTFKPHHTLAVELDDFVVVVADTYAEALVSLFRDWMPAEQSAAESRLLAPAGGRGMTYPSTGGHDPDVPAGGTDMDGAMLSTANHPSDGPGVNYSTPPQYIGPDVPGQPALVNPSGGNQGPTESGMDDVNPQGPAPQPGSTGPVNNRTVYPDTTKGYPH